MIEQSVLLPCPIEWAFALFTDGISDWWPPEHRLTRDPASTVHLQSGGRFFERAADGREMELGRVRVWDAPARLVLDFYLGTGPDRPTEVTVRFEPCDDGTRVCIEHRATPSSIELWGTRSPAYVKNWSAVLAALGRAAARR